MGFHVEVHTNSVFSSLDAARAAARSVEVLLANGDSFSHSGSVKIYETNKTVKFKAHSIVDTSYDYSNSVVGGQEAEDNVRKISAHLEKTLTPVDTSVDSEVFWEEFAKSARATGEFSYERFDELARERFGDEASEGAISAAVGAIAASAVSGKLIAVRNAKAKEARRAQNQKKK